MLRFDLAALSLLAALSISASAEAFTVRETEKAVPIRWPAGTIRVVVDPSLAAIAPSPEVWVAEAFATWADAEGALPPEVIIESGAADEVGYRARSENHNTVRFAPGGSPLAGGSLAITVVTFDDNGTILDADIVINGGAERPFSRVGISGSADAFDVDSVMTHEVGHFFGLGESADHPDATMYPETGRGEINKRDLAEDDIAGLQSLYPVAFGSACSVTRGAKGAGGAAPMFLIGAACALRLARRRRR